MGRPRTSTKISPKTRLTLYLSDATAKKFMVHATMMGLDYSQLAERLFNDHLKQYVVQDRGPKGGAGEGAEVAE